MEATLTTEQIDAIEGMIARRLENTDETREQACEHIANYLRSRAEDLQNLR